MARYYQRPENAISKAEEFIQVGKPNRALDTLYDVIKSKSKRNNSSERLIEQIMFKYLELCVDLKKSHVAKEGLFQYRNMCQATNVASLAAVVQGYLNLAEKRTDTAKQESQDSAQEVDDLENLATPEMIMLSAVSGEDAQDRSDRKILMPWVKFLWESYCQCLELLRTNVRVERLYHDIAQQAFRFCLKYQRKTEFRKLCDKLRNHLDLILKQTPSPVTINLNNAETQQMNLDTRLVQLDAAIQMELWQEAYKAVEDIHGLMTLSKKVFQPKMMANYYQKLALVFWKSGNLLFHAAAVSKHFQLTREMKRNISSDELGKMASRVLVACLAVPIPSQHPDFDKFIETDRTPQEKMARLAVLLSLQQPPTRQTLLKDAVRFGVVQAATPQVQDIYQWLEVDFHPLKLCRRIEKGIKFIEDSEDFSNLTQYIPALKDVTLVRLLKQVSQVYQSMQFSRLLELAPFTDSFSLESVIVSSVRHNDMQIRIDHRTQTVHFGTDLAEAQSRDVAEGPHLQDMPSEQIRTQLMRMLEVLDRSLKTIHPDKVKIENDALRSKIVEAYHHSKQREHKRILDRHKAIEERKEYLEKLSIHREAEEQRKQELQMRERQKAEEERLRAEQVKRDERKYQEQMRVIQKEHIEMKLNQIKQTELGKKILDKMDEKEIAELDTEQIMAKQVEELEKEKRDLLARLKAQEKKVDHMERAKRKEEIPLLKEASEKDKEEDKVWWSNKEADRIKQAIADREVAVKTKKRLIRMKEDKDKYLGDLLKERKSAFEKKMKDYNVKLEKERALKLAERKRQRKEDRREKWVRDREEEEQRRREEQLKKEREERARIEREKREREEEEYRKNKEKLDAIAAKQREREREVEERMAREREESRNKAREAAGRDQQEDGRGNWRRGGNEDGEGSSWRDRRRGEDEDEDGEPPRRRGGDRDDDRDRPPMRRDRDAGERPSGAWRPGGGSWRDRERRKDDEWGPGERRDDERRGPPRRDDDRGPMRRGGDYERGPIRRGGDDEHGQIRRGGEDDRRPPPRKDEDDWRRGDRGGPPRRDDRDRDRGGMRRGGDDDRGGMRRGGDDDRGGMRRGGDDDRGGGGWRRQDDRRDRDRRDDRDRDGRRDDRDRDRRDDRGPPRRRPPMDGEENWRSGPRPQDERKDRRDDKRGPSGKGDRDKERRGGGEKGGAGGGGGGGGGSANQEDDGWTTVTR